MELNAWLTVAQLGHSNAAYALGGETYFVNSRQNGSANSFGFVLVRTKRFWFSKDVWHIRIMFSNLSDRCLYFSCLNFNITLLYIFSFCVWLGWNHASLETCCWSPAHKLSWVFHNYLLGNNQLIVAGSCWQSMGEVGCKDMYSAALINSFWLLWLLVIIHRFHGRHWFVCKHLPTCTETKKCDTKWKWDCLTWNQFSNL